MALLTLGLSHHRAPVEVRSRMAFAESEAPDALVRLNALPGVSESALISTCNRTEIVALVENDMEGKLRDWWQRERAAGQDFSQYLYTHKDIHSVTHNLRVAAGLDSMILGESEILGQMKKAYAQAQELNSLGPVLSRLFQHAFAFAKLARSETEVGAHPVSVAYAAVQLAKRIFADLREQTVLIVGAGETAQLIARHMRGQGVKRLIVANRSLERAEKLARDVHGYAVPLSDLSSWLPEADVVVSSTASREPIIYAQALKLAHARRRRKPVLMIDLAVPRDVEAAVADLEDVYLYTVDDLQSVVTENLKVRELAAKQAEALAQQHASEFVRWLENRDVAGVIADLRIAVKSHQADVMEKARKQLARGDDPEKVMEFIAETLSNKLLHSPSAALRKASGVEQAMLVNSATRLFDLPEKES